MCILFVYRNPDAGPASYRLILASNRDEDLKRPALPAHYWKDHPQCFGGCDMESGREGGTWLGVSMTGKAGVLLNLFNKANSSESSKQGRGFLVTDFLTSKDSMDCYLNRLYNENKNNSKYNPFLLILMNLYNADVKYISSKEAAATPSPATDSVLGFGNSGIGVSYKKVDAGKDIFREIIADVTVANQTKLIEELATFLKSSNRYLPDPVLQGQHPGKYKDLSSIFVSTEGYGTRTHSILLVNGNNDITFVEDTLMPDSTWKRKIFNEKLIRED